MNTSELFERHLNAERFKGSEPFPYPAEPEPEHDLAWEAEIEEAWLMGYEL